MVITYKIINLPSRQLFCWPLADGRGLLAQIYSATSYPDATSMLWRIFPSALVLKVFLSLLESLETYNVVENLLLIFNTKVPHSVS